MDPFTRTGEQCTPAFTSFYTMTREGHAEDPYARIRDLCTPTLASLSCTTTRVDITLLHKDTGRACSCIHSKGHETSVQKLLHRSPTQGHGKSMQLHPFKRTGDQYTPTLTLLSYTLTREEHGGGSLQKDRRPVYTNSCITLTHIDKGRAWRWIPTKGQETSLHQLLHHSYTH